jgi:hypothetical protein
LINLGQGDRVIDVARVDEGESPQDKQQSPSENGKAHPPDEGSESGESESSGADAQP